MGRRPARRARWRGLAAIVGLPLSLLGAGCEKVEGPAAPAAATAPASRPRADATWPNVVLVSIDTLRPDHLGCYGYARPTSPNIDRVAAEGALFTTAISSAPWTLPAHTAMFTGLADSVHKVLDTTDRLDRSRYTLAERLKDVGYATAGFFSGPYLHPVFGLGQGFDVYTDCTSYAELNQSTAEKAGLIEGKPIWDKMHADVTNPRVVQAVTSWLREQPEGPFFLFMHLWDVHFDFIPPPPYDRMFDPDYDGDITGENFFFSPRVVATMPKRDLEHLIALYDGEIAWTDHCLGQILDELRKQGRYENSILIITADHGSAFFEHGLKAHRNALYDEVIRIPLIVRAPGRIAAGVRCGEQARSIDILPTIIDILGLPSAQVMGQSLTPALTGGKLPRGDLALSELFSMGLRMRSYRRPEHKLIHDEAGDRRVTFDLSSDPHEQRPLTDRGASAVKGGLSDAEWAARWLDEFRAAFPAGGEASEIPTDVRKKLEALGYLKSGDGE